MIYAFLILALICAALIGLCMMLLGQLDAQARSFAHERGALLQRIQAPERAAAAHGRTEDPERRRYVPVALDDDAAMARAHGEEDDEEVSDDGAP